MQDHPNTRLTFHCSQPITINDVLQNPIFKVRQGLKYMLTGKGLLSICSATAHTVMRSRPDETSPDLKLQLQPFSGKDRYARRPQDGLDAHSGFTVGVMGLKPKSRGYVHIASADPFTYPRIDPRYLEEPEDAEVLLKGIKAVREIASKPSLKKLIVSETRPGAGVVTDEQIMDYIRETTQTTWHIVGTCKMGADPDAVVDPQLRVRGINGLRVVDSSVFPTIPSSNTNAPTIALAERASEIIVSGNGAPRIEPRIPANAA
jgi:choline dehydrogenase